MIELLRKENAPGTDGRTSELYKALTSCLNKSLADVFNVILEVKWKKKKKKAKSKAQGELISQIRDILEFRCKLLQKVFLSFF